MENIINYVENFGNFSFEEKPFNDVDSLVFSQLVYLRFNKGVPNIDENCKAIKLADVLDHIDSPKEFFVAYDTTSIKLLFLAVISSRRYKNTKLNYKMLKTDGNEEMQFFALSFLLENGDTYVAFRGTDGTIIGWKEDFNMSFMDEIPSQIEAV
ncbi:MAG: Mbeg1-like protein, partial [Clostridia bacterium]